jgi:hypothetical protein
MHCRAAIRREELLARSGSRQEYTVHCRAAVRWVDQLARSGSRQEYALQSCSKVGRPVSQVW